MLEKIQSLQVFSSAESPLEVFKSDISITSYMNYAPWPI